MTSLTQNESLRRQTPYQSFLPLCYYKHLYCAAPEDYTFQETEFIFPPGTLVGDAQCLGIPITDDNDVNNLRVRSFSVELVSIDPLVRVSSGRGSETITIIDNERK